MIDKTLNKKVKTSIKVLGFTVSSLVAAAAIFLLFPGKAMVQTTGTDYGHYDLAGVQQSMRLSTVKQASNLDSALARLKSTSDRTDRISEQGIAWSRGLETEDNKVQVVLSVISAMSQPGITGEAPEHIRSPELLRAGVAESVERVKSEVQALGGHISRVSGNLVRCWVPIDQLDAVASLPLVRSVRQPIKLTPHVITEGYTQMGAFLFNEVFPFHASETRVMVLDVGFEGYTDLMGGELPTDLTTRSFLAQGGLEDGGVHGTACAEIIHDIARDAKLYLANILYTSDVVDALNWGLENEVDIISYSLGTYFGPGDGTGSMASLASQVKQSGITWVTSAGNEAQRHWSGTFNDPDGDGWHNFSGDDEILEFFVDAETATEEGVYAILKWYDWGTYDDNNGFSGTTQDYDLYLFVKIDDAWMEIDSSTNPQPGYKWPWEQTNLWNTQQDLTWGVAIKKFNANKAVSFDLYIREATGPLEYVVPEGSLSIPADAADVITVGAIDAEDYFYHSYSSQGPTRDGRIKPDLVAPSGVSVSSTTYGHLDNGLGFYGTSASTPHMAAAIALFKLMTPYTSEEIVDIIMSRVKDMGTPGPDNIFGRGRLDLRPN